MRQKRLKFSAILLLGLGLAELQAQTMYVKQSNGTQTAYVLSSIKNMTFSGGNLIVNKMDNNSGVFSLNSLKNMNFTSPITSSEALLSFHKQSLNAYPNPASNILNIDLTGTSIGEGTLRILNFEGKTLLSHHVSNVGVFLLDISNLAKGIYFCHFSNVTEVKTVKIIKL